MDAVANGRPVTPRTTVGPWKSSAFGTTRWPSRTTSPKRSANRSGGGRPGWTPCGLSFSSGDQVTDERGDYLADVWRDAAWKRACAPTSFSPFRFPIRFWTRRGMPACFPACGGACLRRTACGRWPRTRPVIVLCMKAARPNAMRPTIRGTVSGVGAGGSDTQEAVCRAAWDVPGSVRELLRTIRPLFAQHLGDAGIGSVSGIFDGDPPIFPTGASRAWSVAECLRFLCTCSRRPLPASMPSGEANAGKEN